MKIHRKLPWVSLYNNTTRPVKGSQLINDKMADFLFCFKKHLWNYLSKCKETLQEASLGDLQKFNKGSRWISVLGPYGPLVIENYESHMKSFMSWFFDPACYVVSKWNLSTLTILQAIQRCLIYKGNFIMVFISISLVLSVNIKQLKKIYLCTIDEFSWLPLCRDKTIDRCWVGYYDKQHVQP